MRSGVELRIRKERSWDCPEPKIGICHRHLSDSALRATGRHVPADRTRPASTTRKDQKLSTGRFLGRASVAGVPSRRARPGDSGGEAAIRRTPDSAMRVSNLMPSSSAPVKPDRSTMTSFAVSMDVAVVHAPSSSRTHGPSRDPRSTSRNRRGLSWRFRVIVFTFDSRVWPLSWPDSRRACMPQPSGWSPHRVRTAPDRDVNRVGAHQGEETRSVRGAAMT